MLNEDLRKMMGEAFEKGDFTKALELSQLFDKQVLNCTKNKLQQADPNTETNKHLYILNRPEDTKGTYSKC